MDLSNCQKKAYKKFQEFISGDEPEFMICGASGTGKTYLISECMRWLEANKTMCKIIGMDGSYDIYYTASTNKAAAVLAEVVETQVTTIHKLLALRPMKNFETGETFLKKTKDTPLIDGAILVIDEFSMLDSDLVKIIRDHTKNCKLLWIGDHLQLAPIFSSTIPAYETCTNRAVLTEVMRNGGEIERISTLWSKAVEGEEFPTIVSGDNVSLLRREDYVAKLHELYSNREEAKTLAWTNKTVQKYNAMIQDDILSERMFTEDTDMIVNTAFFSNNAYYPSDSVVTLRSDPIEVSIDLEMYGSPAITEVDAYKIHIEYKGSTVEQFVSRDYEDHTLKIKLAAKEKNWKLYFFLKDNILQLRQAHASTINKAQGSTFDYVFIDLGDVRKCRKPIEFARMMYVAISRARRHVYILG